MPKKHNKMAIWYVISAVLLVVLAIIAPLVWRKRRRARQRR